MFFQGLSPNGLAFAQGPCSLLTELVRRGKQFSLKRRTALKSKMDLAVAFSACPQFGRLLYPLLFLSPFSKGMRETTIEF